MDLPFQTVCVLGLGYIGLPTAAMLASRRVRVLGVDINPEVVETINQGRVHIVEPELDIIVSAAVDQGFLRATNRPAPADAFLIAVPTPLVEPEPDTTAQSRLIPKPDIGYVEDAARSIAPVLKKGDLVILESTSPVGTTEQVVSLMSEIRPDLTFPHQAGENADINIAYCPERVMPGRIVHELVHNDRIIGGMTTRCAERATQLYQTFVSGKCIATNCRTAEMCKLTENAYRDVNIAFANELSLICDELGINVWELIHLANRHPRVNILRPGPGVGGHCIAVDPWFIVHSNPNIARLIRTAREVNDAKPQWVVEKVLGAVTSYLKENPDKTAENVTIACFGLAFKPDIDDLRESPAMEITCALAQQHPGPVLAVEPNIHTHPHALPERVVLVTAEEARRQAQIAVLLVAHTSFCKMERGEWEKLRYLDACGILCG